MLVVPRLKQAARRSKQSDTTPTLMSCDAHQNVVQLAYCNTMKRFSCIYLYELLNMQWAQPFVSSWRVHHKIPCIASRMRWPIAGPWRRLYRTGCGIRFFFALAAGWVFSPPRSCRIHCKVNDKNSLPLMRRCDSSSRRHPYCCYWKMHKMLLAILPHPTEAVGLEAVITLRVIAISHTFWVLETSRDSGSSQIRMIFYSWFILAY